LLLTVSREAPFRLLPRVRHVAEVQQQLHLATNKKERKPAMTPINTITQGDCIKAMTELDAASVDFVLTDPPYIVDYRGRDGRNVTNDDNSRWLRPAFRMVGAHSRGKPYHSGIPTNPRSYDQPLRRSGRGLGAPHAAR
jgi:hypothetical protein